MKSLLALLALATVALSSELRSSLTVEPHGLVRFTTTNDGSTPKAFLTRFTPFDEMMPAYNFDVDAVYVGIVARRAKPDLSEYITLAPGDSIEATLDLSEYYQGIEGSNFLSVPVTFQGTEDVLASNTIYWRPETTFSFNTDREELHSAKAPSYQNCNSGDVSYVSQYDQKAQQQNGNAVSCLSRQSCNSLYSTWYGTSSSSRYSQVQKTHQSVQSAFSSYIAYCRPSGCGNNVYAYVYPTDRNKTVYLCNLFFNARSEAAETIVHELSHFNAVAGTRDYAYGESACKNLARSNPDRAIANADNVCYFARYA